MTFCFCWVIISYEIHETPNKEKKDVEKKKSRNAPKIVLAGGRHCSSCEILVKFAIKLLNCAWALWKPCVVMGWSLSCWVWKSKWKRVKYNVRKKSMVGIFLWPIGPSLWLLSHGFDVCLYIFLCHLREYALYT